MFSMENKVNHTKENEMYANTVGISHKFWVTNFSSLGGINKGYVLVSRNIGGAIAPSQFRWVCKVLLDLEKNEGSGINIGMEDLEEKIHLESE